MAKFRRHEVNTLGNSLTIKLHNTTFGGFLGGRRGCFVGGEGGGAVWFLVGRGFVFSWWWLLGFALPGRK